MSALADIFAAVHLQLDEKGFQAQATALGNKAGMGAGSVMGRNLNSNLAKGLRGSEKALGTFKGRITSAASSIGMLAGVGGTLAIAGGLASAITQAKNFGQQMELIRTQAGATQTEVDSMSTSLLAMAREVATTPEKLAMGLYHVESAGLRGAKALEVLKVAAEGAKVGNADLEAVTNALVAANQSGVKGVESMTGAMGTLNGIVGAGNMRMQDLADAMGTGVLSTAKNYGVSLQSVGAALASMTDQGIPAVDAATRLNSAMRLMAAPTSKAIKLLKSIGLDQTQLANDLRGPGGMLTAITDLKKHLDKSGLSLVQQSALIAGAFGGKQSGAILTLIGNVDLLGKKTAAVAKGAGAFGDAWAATQEEASFKWDRFNASLSAAAIKIGTVALPVVTQALDDIGAWVDTHGDELASGFKAAMSAAQALLATIGGLAKAAGAFWNMIPAPFRDLLVKGFVADRTIKFLFGVSPGKLVLDLLAPKLLGSLFQRGSSPANPMFVSGGGIGLPGAAGGAGALALLPAVGLAALIVAAAIPIGEAFKSILPKELLGPGGLGMSESQRRITEARAAMAASAVGPGFGNSERAGLLPMPTLRPTFGFGNSERAGIADAVALGTERGLIHSGVFKKAQTVREAAGLKTSADVLKADLHAKGTLGTDALVTGQAIALAVGNHLRTDQNPDLKSAAYNLGLLKSLQAALPANLAAQLAPKIHSLEVAINRTTAAVEGIKLVQNIQNVREWNNPGNPKPKPKPKGISVQDTQNIRGAAGGGLFRPREPIVVGERRPELLIPDVGVRIEPRVPSGGVGGNTYNVNVQGLLRAHDPFEVATQLRRLSSFGVLTPRTVPA